MKFTESNVQRAKPSSRKYEIADDGTPGLYLRVLPSGKRVYIARFRVDGKDKRVRLGLPGQLTVDDARAKATAYIQGKVTTTKLKQAKAVRFSTLAEKYRREHAQALSASTIKSVRVGVRELNREFGHRLVIDIAHDEVCKFHRSLSDRPYAANWYTRLGHIIKKGQQWGLVPRTHALPTAEYVRYFPEGRIERFLTPAERRRLERVLSQGEALPRYRKGSVSWFYAAAIRLLSLTGFRASEALDLQWDWIDRRHRVIVLPRSKTGVSRRPVSQRLLDFLDELEREHRKPGIPYVLYGQRDKRVRFNALSEAWRKIRRRAGLDDVRLHDLRHSAASDAIMAGVSLEVVSKILGHSTSKTTRRYAHLANDHILAGADAMADVIASACSASATRTTSTTSAAGACGEPDHEAGIEDDQLDPVRRRRRRTKKTS